MVEQTNHQPNIEYVRDLLSPYLDGEVTDSERALVEQAVATLPEVRDELESLRQTVTLVQALPRVPAPRPFTLSEADVRVVSPPSTRKLFNLPAWASGLAMLAAALICVLAAGGLFLGQFSSTQPAAEIAYQPDLEAPAEEPAAPIAEKAEQAAVEAQKVAETVEVEKEVVVEKEAEFATEAPAAEVAPAEGSDTNDADTIAGSTTTSGETEAARGREEETLADAAPTSSATPTLSPLPTPTVTVAAVWATEIAEQAGAEEDEEAAAAKPAEAGPSVVAEAPAKVEPPAEEEHAPPPAPEPQFEQKEIVPRLVEIRDQTLRVTPGFIQIEGVIEAAPGSTLQATLQRNDEAFDNWANPGSLQTVVQANSQFSFTIQAKDQANRDLFALEPANYQITIISVGTDEPVIASVFFDTFTPPTTSEDPLATIPLPTPSPSPTLIARLTFIPTTTPTVEKLDVAPTPIADTESRFPLWVVSIIVVVVLLGVLVIIGLIVGVIIRRKK
jgi:anti-sigma factor RsiW